MHHHEQIISLEEIKNRIEAFLPGAEVKILDPRHDGVHLQAMVRYTGFKGKSLLEQHRMVYQALEKEIKSEALHALSIKTEA